MRRALVLSVLLVVLLAVPAGRSSARGLLIFVGDGMGPQHLGLLLTREHVRRQAPGALARLLERGNVGLVGTWPLGSLVTDSAAAATAMGTGRTTLAGLIGLDGAGHPVPNLFEAARTAGLGTGVISSIRVTDATPAGFYAHEATRYHQRQIADQLIATGVDVALGGGVRYFLPKGTVLSERCPGLAVTEPRQDVASRDDERDLLAEAADAGYETLWTRAALLGRRPGSSRRLLGLFSPDAMPYVIDEAAGEAPTVPTLAEMTSAALDVLGRRPAGFVLVVEGAKIDWASHGNDAAAVMHELLDFDAAVAVGLGFAETHPDTTVVALADHETGGPSFSYRQPAVPTVSRVLPSGVTWDPYLDYGSAADVAALERQRGSLQTLWTDAGGKAERLAALVAQRTPWRLSVAEARALLRSSPSRFYPYDVSRGSALLAGKLAPQAGVVWATGTHSTTPVVVAATGPGASGFRGLHDHAAVGRLFAELVAGHDAGP